MEAGADPMRWFAIALYWNFDRVTLGVRRGGLPLLLIFVLLSCCAASSDRSECEIWVNFVFLCR